MTFLPEKSPKFKYNLYFFIIFKIELILKQLKDNIKKYSKDGG